MSLGWKMASEISGQEKMKMLGMSYLIKFSSHYRNPLFHIVYYFIRPSIYVTDKLDRLHRSRLAFVLRFERFSSQPAANNGKL